MAETKKTKGQLVRQVRRVDGKLQVVFVDIATGQIVNDTTGWDIYSNDFDGDAPGGTKKPDPVEPKPDPVKPRDGNGGTRGDNNGGNDYWANYTGSRGTGDPVKDITTGLGTLVERVQSLRESVLNEGKQLVNDVSTGFGGPSVFSGTPTTKQQAEAEAMDTAQSGATAVGKGVSAGGKTDKTKEALTPNIMDNVAAQGTPAGDAGYHDGNTMFPLAGNVTYLGGISERTAPIKKTIVDDLAALTFASNPDAKLTIISGAQVPKGQDEMQDPYGNKHTTRHGTTTNHDANAEGEGSVADVVLSVNGERVTQESDPELYGEFIKKATAMGFTQIGAGLNSTHLGKVDGEELRLWTYDANQNDIPWENAPDFLHDAVREGIALRETGEGATLLEQAKQAVQQAFQAPVPAERGATDTSPYTNPTRADPVGMVGDLGSAMDMFNEKAAQPNTPELTYPAGAGGETFRDPLPGEMDGVIPGVTPLPPGVGPNSADLFNKPYTPGETYNGPMRGETPTTAPVAQTPVTNDQVAQPTQSTLPPGFDYTLPPGQSTVAQAPSIVPPYMDKTGGFAEKLPSTALQDNAIDAFLDTLNMAEGSPQADQLFNYKPFDPAGGFPNIMQYYGDPADPQGTTAAGFLQINKATYDQFAPLAGVQGRFDLDAQKAIGKSIMEFEFKRKRTATDSNGGLLYPTLSKYPTVGDALASGDTAVVADVTKAMSGRWASLPGGKQTQTSIPQIVSSFNDNLSTRGSQSTPFDPSTVKDKNTGIKEPQPFSPKPSGLGQSTITGGFPDLTGSSTKVTGGNKNDRDKDRDSGFNESKTGLGGVKNTNTGTGSSSGGSGRTGISGSKDTVTGITKNTNTGGSGSSSGGGVSKPSEVKTTSPSVKSPSVTKSPSGTKDDNSDLKNKTTTTRINKGMW